MVRDMHMQSDLHGHVVQLHTCTTCTWPMTHKACPEDSMQGMFTTCSLGPAVDITSVSPTLLHTHTHTHTLTYMVVISAVLLYKSMKPPWGHTSNHYRVIEIHYRLCCVSVTMFKFCTRLWIPTAIHKLNWTVEAITGFHTSALAKQVRIKVGSKHLRLVLVMRWKTRATTMPSPCR